MHYPIPTSLEEIFALCSQPVDEEMIVVAIAGVVKLARSQGQSLDELTAEVLQDDPMLDLVQRRWLSNLVEQAWQVLP
ncbi:hypothetical protein RGRSB_0618 [cyanobacterium endosymbiont of Rhopalodia gibberula]|uniref:hypothetical protein n=1 Tax=cyanobacterium endosymbiont of Rhopalodia gibberula TaxID=1763363 RepID=UPI000DC731F0|nr:hypothetical protein [cyanobacterium endosymbiont of Rhopalodia gibberula]BBA79180.1 hypothetical protein RGRSB_0618 [cyanobacterium endosymbiont of Rhopalodia gibberula]